MNKDADIILSPTVETIRASGHHYCVQTVQLAVQEIINCGSSLRGVEKIFGLYEEFTSLEAPSFSIRAKMVRPDWFI